MSLTILANYENAMALPIGTLVELTGCTRNGGCWNGRQHVKTGESTWAIVHHTATPEQIAEMVARRENNISPAPSSDGGSWIIQNPDVVFAALIQRVGIERRAREGAQTRAHRIERRLEDILSFVTGEESWERVEDDE